MTAPPIGFRPYPWQSTLAKALVRLGSVSCDAPPGAGKTHAAMLCAHGLQPQLTVIISPAGKVCSQWLETAKQWGLRAVLVGGKGEGGPKLKAALEAAMAPGAVDAIVIPWSRCQRKPDGLAILSALHGTNPTGRLLVVDELHYAQAAEATTRGRIVLGGHFAWKKGQRREWHKGIRQYFGNVLGLSGTPVKGQPTRVRAALLLAGLDRFPKTLLRDKYAYEAKFWGGKMIYNWAAKRELWETDDRPTKLHNQLVRRGILSVSREAIRGQLPALRRELLTDFYGGDIPDVVYQWSELGMVEVKALPSLEIIADVRRDATTERMDDIATLVEAWNDSEDMGRLLLVWCVYQNSADNLTGLLRRKLKDAAIECVHGATTPSRKKDLLAKATSGGVRVLVTTHASCGTGVDGLQNVCNQALVVEAPWDAGDAEQTEGRIVRSGQKDPVLTRWVCAGVESLILTKIGIKAGAVQDVMAAARTIGNA